MVMRIVPVDCPPGLGRMTERLISLGEGRDAGKDTEKRRYYQYTCTEFLDAARGSYQPRAPAQRCKVGLILQRMTHFMSGNSNGSKRMSVKLVLR